jgi:hypothetical protein
MRINPNDGIYRMHYGEDTLGEGNYAPVTGTVVFAAYDYTGTGLGYAVGVRESANPSVIWWVAHHASLNVSVGQSVTEAVTKLGVKGSSGAAQGVHCHTERRVGGAARPGSGTATNPRSYYTNTAGGDVTPLPDTPTRKKRSMTTVYWDGQNPTGGNARWALAGDSPGTTANWIETGDRTLADKWAAVHGPIVDCGSSANFGSFRGWYQQPLNVAGGTGGGGLTSAQNDALMGLPAAVSDLPTNGELGQALTSTVALVNEHADGNKAEIIAAIPQGGSGGASPYSLSIDIDSVPGTATGTATPA